MTFEETNNLLRGLAAAYPNTKLKDPQTMAAAWFDMFSSEDKNAVGMAIRLYMRKGKFFPKPAEIFALLPLAKSWLNKQQAEARKNAPVERATIALETRATVNATNVTQTALTAVKSESRDCYTFCPYYSIGKCYGDRCRL